MLLKINTNDSDNFSLWLLDKDNKALDSMRISTRDKKLSRLLLPSIDKFFKKNNEAMNDISKILIVTSISKFNMNFKIGMAGALALGYGLKIPISKVKT